jgi:DNA-binding response OmpR family regulator
LTQPRLHDIRVLIVDDDPDILGSIDLAMRAEGAVTELASDGNAAVHACSVNPPALVVLDMMLPRRSGFLVLEKVKQMEDPPAVIMVTANEGRRHMAYAQALGVDAYMQKPVPLQRLVDKAVELVEARLSRGETR